MMKHSAGATGNIVENDLGIIDVNLIMKMPIKSTSIEKPKAHADLRCNADTSMINM